MGGPKAKPKYVQRNGSSYIFYIANMIWYFARSNLCLTTTYVYGCVLLSFTSIEIHEPFSKLATIPRLEMKGFLKPRERLFTVLREGALE
jgi:hypothetical protein